jgi:hypothetical protein
MTPISIMRPPHDGQRSIELLVALAIIGGRGRRRWLGDRQQTAAMGQLGGAPAVGEITVVADAVEAVGQGVEQEAGG